ncbi:hypothetical protein VNO77_34333 [Canavalia gladiata]|uniref:Uncharacterized protein n=1 Tax=Canavalia gladiata TaxID=3824 RepID=A0AAN9KDE8_CANGL
MGNQNRFIMGALANDKRSQVKGRDFRLKRGTETCMITKNRTSGQGRECLLGSHGNPYIAGCCIEFLKESVLKSGSYSGDISVFHIHLDRHDLVWTEAMLGTTRPTISIGHLVKETKQSVKIAKDSIPDISFEMTG